MSESKKPKYEPPKVYRVVLNHDQAILSGCSTGTTSISNTTGANCNTSCRRSTSTATSSNSSASS